MSNELIDNYVDRAAFGADTDFIEAELQRVTDSFNKVNSIKVTLQGANSLKDVSTAATQAQSGMADLTAATDRAVQKIAQYNGSSREISQLILLEAKSSKELAAAKDLEAAATLKTAQAKSVEEKARRDNEAATKSAASTQNDAANTTTKLSAAEQKLADSQTEEAKQIAIVNEQRSQQNKTNKEAAINTLGLRDAYQQLNKEYATASQSAKNLQAKALIDPSFKQEAQAAAEKANALSLSLKAIDASVGQFQRNVGNYTGALSILEKGLTQTRAQLAGLTDAQRNNTQSGQQLAKQEELLATFVQQQKQGFTSLTTELRSSERALRTLYEAGLAGTPVFEELQTNVNNATRDVREFQREQTLLSSESAALAGLTAAARGLGGAYAVGAGAAALFADGNEKVEKELQKLVAIMTFLQGLTEFNRFLQEKESIAKSLNAVKTSFLAAAEKLAALATGQATAATTAQIAAETAAIAPAEALAEAQTAVATTNEELAVSGEAAGAGLAAESLGADGLAASLGGVEAAEAGVAAGASTMATAIAATGIGLLIVGLAVVTYKIIEAIKDWNAANESVKKSNEDLAKSLKDLVDATKQLDDINRGLTTRQLDDLDRLIAKRKALGVNSLQGLALDKQIADARLKASNEEVKLNDITRESIEKRNAEESNAAGVVKANEERKQAYIQQTGNKTKAVENAKALALRIVRGEEELNIENAQKLSVLGDKDYLKKIKQFEDNGKLYKDDLELKKSLYERDSELFESNEKNKQQAELVTNDITKLTADERRKLILETSKIEADLIKNKNDLILSDERSSLAQRIKAIKSNAAEERVVIAAELKSTIDDPTVSDNDKNIARKQANAARIKLAEDTDRKISDQEKIFRDKNLQGELDLNKSKLQADKDFQDRSISDQFTALQENIDALTQSGEDTRQMIENDYEFAKATQVLTEKQRLALDTEYQKKLVDNDRDTQDKIKVQSEKATADFINFLQKKQQASINSANNKVDIKDNTAAIGLITQAQLDESKAGANKRVEIEKKLQKDLADVDKRAQLDKLKIDEQGLEADLANATLIEAPIEDIEKKITDNKRHQAALRKGITDDEYNYEKQQNDKRLEAVRSVSVATLDLEQAFGDASYQKAKDKIQAQQDLNDAKEQRDIDAINASTQSEQDKAAAITIIQARAAAQKTALDLKQRKEDYEKAKFDKAFAIMEVIANIAIDIAKGQFIEAGLAGIALIKLIATPVPHYKHGKLRNDTYEGPAVWGDGGKREMKVSEDGKIEISPTTPTLTHVKAKDLIYPDADHVPFLTANVFRTHDRFIERAKGHNSTDKTSIDIASLEREIKSMKTTLAHAINNKKEIHIKPGYNSIMAIQQYGAQQIKYVHDNTQF